MAKKIVIVGAGPIGSYTAYLLAKQGFSVDVFEEHSEIGKPIQCTGILTDSIYNFFKKSDLLKAGVIRNTIKNARTYSPNKNYFSLNFAVETENIVVDRDKFDIFISEKAKLEGARYHLSHHLTQIRKTSKSILLEFEVKKLNGSVLFQTVKVAKDSIVIGADGPLSRVRKIVNPKKFSISKSKFGIQARIKRNNDGAVDFFPFIESYAWFVPENKKVGRLGVAGFNIGRKDFEKFANYYADKYPSVIEYQAGLIPFFNPKIKFERIVKGRKFYLVGDSAGMVKATTGGGIVPGLIGARCLVDSIIANSCYTKLIQKKLFLKLNLHRKIYKIMSKMSKSDWNNLVAILSSKKIVNIFNTTNRDNILILAFRIFIARPDIVRFVKFLF